MYLLQGSPQQGLPSFLQAFRLQAQVPVGVGVVVGVGVEAVAVLFWTAGETTIELGDWDDMICEAKGDGKK